MAMVVSRSTRSRKVTLTSPLAGSIESFGSRLRASSNNRPGARSSKSQNSASPVAAWVRSISLPSRQRMRSTDAHAVGEPIVR